MTIGIGGSTAEIELAKLQDMTTDISAISLTEFEQRIKKAQYLMKKNNIAATYINEGTNLYYFTGTRWFESERMIGAIITQQGEIQYIAPFFEINSIKLYMKVDGKINGWQEHESPYQLFCETLAKMEINRESTVFVRNIKIINLSRSIGTYRKPIQGDSK